jgi:hypothetical protein
MRRRIFYLIYQMSEKSKDNVCFYKFEVHFSMIKKKINMLNTKLVISQRTPLKKHDFFNKVLKHTE